MKHGLVTDSSSQITDDLVERFDVAVVPMVITIDGVEYHERVDLDADGFYAHFAAGHSPEVSTSQPPPGAFAAVYQGLADQGCDEIWSIHIAAAMSGTIGSAQLAARDAPVPVRVVDTASASFGVATCVWAAADALAGGASADGVRRRIDQHVARLGTAFMAGVPLLIERSGRAAGVEIEGEGIPVLVMQSGELKVLDRVATIEDTIDVMSTYATSWFDAEDRTDGITVAIGTADDASRPLTDRLDRTLADLDGIDQIVHYRVGPSIGAHTGPGTFGLFVFPTIG